MKRLLATVVLLGLTGLALYAWKNRTGSLPDPKAALGWLGFGTHKAKTTAAVKAALTLHRATEPYDIEVKTIEEGVVVLRGQVPREETRATAISVASAVPHVRRVISELRINPDMPAPVDGRTVGESIDDKALEAKVHLALSLNRDLKDTDVSVRSYRKEVTLSGEVEAEAQRRLVVEVARQTGGVRKIVDEIKVREKGPPGADRARDVERALGENPHLAGYRIKVREDAGDLVLTGRVKTGAEKDLAGFLAKDAAGRRVKNDLEVRP